MVVISSTFGGIAFATLGAATLAVPMLADMQPKQASNSRYSEPYSTVIYKTGFTPYITEAVSPLGDSDKLAIINKFVRGIIVNSIPLTKQQHDILSNNLFDFL